MTPSVSYVAWRITDNDLEKGHWYELYAAEVKPYDQLRTDIVQVIRPARGDRYFSNLGLELPTYIPVAIFKPNGLQCYFICLYRNQYSGEYHTKLHINGLTHIFLGLRPPGNWIYEIEPADDRDSYYFAQLVKMCNPNDAIDWFKGCDFNCKDIGYKEEGRYMSNETKPQTIEETLAKWPVGLIGQARKVTTSKPLNGEDDLGTVTTVRTINFFSTAPGEFWAFGEAALGPNFTGRDSVIGVKRVDNLAEMLQGFDISLVSYATFDQSRHTLSSFAAHAEIGR